MRILNNILSPVLLFFVIITVGLLIGKIKFHSISLDISAVLIIAIIVGFLLSHLYPIVSSHTFQNSFTLLSKLGTALFISVIGITSGQNITKSNLKTGWIHIVLGALFVFVGYISTQIISIFDTKMEKSLLLGIFCGAMTSSPGLASICEIPTINSTLATVGYGAAYLCGVVIVVLYVQLFLPKGDNTQEQIVISPNKKSENLLYISIVATIGYLITLLKIPLINTSLGATGGILISGIIFGMIFKNKISGSLNDYRNIGLVMFFIGNGILAGQRLNCEIDLRWFAYAIVITLTSIICGDIFAKLFNKPTVINRMLIIAGGMTSTPALGTLLKNNSKIDLSAYSFAYLGALFTITIGAKLISI